MPDFGWRLEETETLTTRETPEKPASCQMSVATGREECGSKGDC